MRLEKFAEKTANMVNVLSYTPEIPEIKESYYSLMNEELYIIDKIMNETSKNKAKFIAKKTIRAVIMKEARAIFEYEIPENSAITVYREWNPTFYTYKYHKIIAFLAEQEFLISSILEYLEPKNEVGERILKKLSEIECRTCYIEEVEPFTLYEDKAGKMIHYYDVEDEIEDKIHEKIKGVKVKNIEIDTYEVIVYPVVRTGGKISYDYKKLHTHNGRAVSSSMFEKIMDRFAEMHDTLVRGVVKIVERFI